ncbi:MAG TPA: peptidoglycan DD-metalloendopeptidase family protein [Candidatus Limnocylindria bacterium]|nr:peptidoglycan DD-metalloendopeptidase family protein [Candidatus Limnocylindria bacterium]
MARRWRAAAAVLVAAFFVFSQQVPARADDLDDALRRKQELERAVQVSRANAERYRQAASQFEAQVGAANARIADLAAKQRNAQTEADMLAYEIEIAQEQLQLVAFQLEETRVFISSLKAQAAAQARQLAESEQIYAKHLKITYKQARISPLEMLLSSGSLSEFASRVQAMILINRQDARLAGEIRVLRERTAEQQVIAKEKELEINGLQDQIATQRKALETKKAEYDAVVAQMKANIASQAALRADAANNAAAQRSNQRAANLETANLNKQLEIAEANYAFLAAQLAARSGLGAFNGSKLNLWPVSGPVTSGFGPRWGGFHNGLDIAAPMYRPVLAASAGQVVTVGRPYAASGDYAVVVIIAHGNNFSTLYGHLDDSRWPPVRVGQWVNAGQPIGFIGMTGWTTGPHVHFMTIRDGRAQDPRIYLP